MFHGKMWNILRIPKGKRIMADVPFKGTKIKLPTETDLPYQFDRVSASVNLDGIGMVYVDKSKIKEEWITQVSRNSEHWKEAKYIGGSWKNQAYTQENASKPIHADKMWYE